MNIHYVLSPCILVRYLFQLIISAAVLHVFYYSKILQHCRTLFQHIISTGLRLQPQFHKVIVWFTVDFSQASILLQTFHLSPILLLCTVFLSCHSFTTPNWPRPLFLSISTIFLSISIIFLSISIIDTDKNRNWKINSVNLPVSILIRVYMVFNPI